MLESKQKSVGIQMVLGLFLAGVIMWLGYRHGYLGHEPEIGLEDRLKLIALLVIVPGIFVAYCVARLAALRFFNSQDMDCLPGTTQSEKASTYQRILQNTLEQSFLAVCAYLSWAMLASPASLSVLPAAALLFAIGRMLFIVGYGRGAKGRSLGFALTFFPTVLLFVGLQFVR